MNDFAILVSKCPNEILNSYFLNAIQTSSPTTLTTPTSHWMISYQIDVLAHFINLTKHLSHKKKPLRIKTQNSLPCPQYIALNYIQESIRGMREKKVIKKKE